MMQQNVFFFLQKYQNFNFNSAENYVNITVSVNNFSPPKPKTNFQLKPRINFAQILLL